MAFASQNPTQYSASTSRTQYDAFLSFRGKDTRYTFADHLYTALDCASIRTFRDTPELRSGEVLSRALPRAIHESKTYIIVFSENYASSTWCLDELVEILNCQKTMGRLVIPVFYNIDPSVVRHQIGSYNEAFQKHLIHFEARKINEWKLTLTEVADFSGYDTSKNRYEANIIKEIVERILYKINPKTLPVAIYPVGLDSRVKEITSLLSSDTGGLIRIGIYGMGGVGKTTLAKAVYNQNYHLFEGSCFLANVRDASSKEKGILRLQRQLIYDVLKRKNIRIDNVDQGIELIRARICSAKVLIVIDDLYDQKVLEHIEGPFASGSRIIITTRNEDLLDAIKVEARYKVNELSKAESRQLFTHHAFGDNNISETFMALSHEILERSGGLPLALKVFGSNLINQSKEGWEWYIDKSRRVPINEVEKILLISFEALELDYLKDIFLDIACFFAGREEEEIVNIMETCYTLVNYNINILKKRSLLSINNGDELGMHHLLREMGRKIVRNRSPNNPGKYSRLWVSEEICDVLTKNKGTEAIEGIIPHNLDCPNVLEGVSITTETFKMMSKLRFLYLENVDLTGSFEHKFKVLRLLRWKYCPLKWLPSEFYPEELVILELPHSKIKTMWELNMVSHVFNELKTLDMSYSLDLTTTPDFTNLRSLVTLNLEGCKSLEEVHVSIGSLVRLVSLNLCGCVKLKNLPDTICNLKTMEVLCVADCNSLEALPKDLGGIESLKDLDVKGLTVSKLPDSIGRLSKLVELKLSFKEDLEYLSNTIGNLISLKHLAIFRCKNVGKVKRLRELTASGAAIFKNLPIQFLNPGNRDHKDCRGLFIAELPSSLKWIKAVGCTEQLPNLSNLKQLEILELIDCSGLTTIQGLKELTSIRILCLGGCNSSLLALSLTERFFQIYSEFGHQIEIYIGNAKFPDWISQSSNLGSPLSLDLPPNVSQNYLAMILCFKHWGNKKSYRRNFSVKTSTSNFIWSGDAHCTPDYHESCMIIVPRSILLVSDGNDKIEIAAEAEIYGIHLLYQTETTMTDGYNSTAVIVEDEGSYPSKRLKFFESDD
ncbi:TMV resistance protein N-like [Apium graveolens]|uniref:TMV resistance protein N-like n=1 Tax=Apium graveolens TaxID=4045 RepID=UPI003D7952F6